MRKNLFFITLLLMLSVCGVKSSFGQGCTLSSTDPTAPDVCSSGTSIIINSTLSNPFYETWTTSGAGVVTYVTSGTGGGGGAYVQYTGAAAGPVTILYDDGAGHSCTYLINVDDPTAPIAGPTSVCTGSPVSLTDVTGGGAWSVISGPLSSLGGGSFSSSGSGSATVQYSASNLGCYTTSSLYNVMVNALPSAGSILGVITPFCVGTTMTLNETVPGGTWGISSGSAYASITHGTGIVSGLAAGTAYVTYTVTDPVTGCTNTTAPTAIVVSAPTVSPISGGSAICETSPLPLILTDPSTGTTTTWSVSSTALVTPALMGGAYTLTPTGAGTGTVTVSYTVTTGGCSTTVTSVVSVDGIVTPTITGPTNICVTGAGGPTMMTGTPAGGNWTSAVSSVATIVHATGAVSPVAAGVTSIQYMITNSCNTFFATPFLLTVDPSTIAPIVGPIGLCTGATGGLNDLTPGGVFTSGDPSICAITSAGIMTASSVSTGPVTMTYSVVNTCSPIAPATYVVTVSSPISPVGITGGPLSLCAGGVTGTLYETSIGGSWSTSDPSIATVSSGGVVTSGSSAGTATISYTISTSGCDASATESAVVHPLPNAGVIGGPSSVCSGSSITLTDSGDPAGTWSSSNPSIASVAGGIVTGAGTTSGSVTISYSVATSFLCSATATYTVNVDYLPPTAAITAVTSYTLCPGGAAITLNDATVGGTWSSSNTGVATINSSGVVTSVASGVTTISYTVISGACMSVATQDVTVNPFPTAGFIVGGYIVCQGSLTPLINLGGDPGGTWYSSNTSLATVSSGGVVTAGTTSTGTVLISYTVSALGCSATTPTFPMTINPTPATPLAITGLHDVCTGSTITLSDLSGGGTWASDDPSTAYVSSAGIVTGLTAGTTNISYIETIGTCTSGVSFVMNVHTTPNAGVITGANTVCPGYTISLADPSADPGTWSASNSNASVGGSTGLVTGVTAGTCTITYTASTTWCSAYTTYPVTVNAIATSGPITGVPLTICVGSSYTLTDLGSGGAWSSSDITKATINSSTGVVTGVAPGSVTFTYTVGSGPCSSSTSTSSITVTALPSAGVISSTGGVTHVCAGLTLPLYETVGGGTWSSSNIAEATVSSSGVVTAITSGTVIITYTVMPGSCAAIATYTVYPTSYPVVAAIYEPVTNECIGSATTMTDATSGGTWTSSNPYIASVSGGLVTGLGTTGGSVSISYTVANSSCSTSVYVPFTIYPPAPTGIISGPAYICIGTPATYTTTGSTGAGYSWSSSNPAAATVVSGAPGTSVATGVAAGTTTISYTYSGTGCPGTSTLTVNVATPPTVSPITGPTSACVGGSTFTLSDLTTLGVWNSATPSVATISTSGVVTPSGTTNGTSVISYTYTNTTTMCSTTATVNVTVNPLPSVPTISGAIPISICPGGVTAALTPTSGGVWSSATPSVATVSSTGVVTSVAAGTSTISFTVTALGCSRTAYVIATVNPYPGAGTITGGSSVCAPGTLSLSDITGGVGTASWISSDNTRATVSSTGLVTGVAVGSATISYTVTSSHSCVSTTTNPITVVTTPVVGAISGTSLIFPSSVITLTDGTSGGAWTSGTTSIATIASTTGVLTGVAIGTAPITYSVTNACTTVRANYSVTVSPAVAITVVGSSQLCVPNGVTGHLTETLSASPGLGTWTSGTPAIGTFTTLTNTTTSTTGNVTSVAAGTTIITYSLTIGGITSVAHYTATVNPDPAAGTINGTFPITLKFTPGIPNNYPFSVTGAGPGTYAWSGFGSPYATMNLVTGVLQTLSYAGIGGVSGNVYMIVTNATTGCSNMATSGTVNLIH